MQTKRLAIGFAILIGVIALLLVIPGFIDWGKYQSVATAKVKAATGYDLAINGSLRMSILPAPHASVKNVIVKKPVAGHDDAFLTFENADVRLALLPLLVGKIEIADITLDKPVVTLITYRDGSDNYTPVKPAVVQAPATDAVTGQPVVAQATATEGQSITVNGLKIKNGQIAVRNDAAGTVQNIGIKELHVKADTLSGPFDGDGDIIYGNAHFDVSLSTGGYKAGESLPVQLDVKDSDDRAELKYSGVLATGATKEVQGEMNLVFSDLNAVLKDIGVTAAIPQLGDKTQLSGMLTAGPDYVTLTNGALTLGKTKFNTKVSASGLKGDAKNITAIFETNESLDVDALTKVADKIAKDNEKAKDKDKKDAKSDAKSAPAKTVSSSNAPLVPLNFTLPKAMKADIQLRSRGLKYKGQETGAFDGRITATDGNGDARITLADIPGGGNISISASTGEAGAINGTLIATLDSLKTTLGEWLDVADKKTFDQPGIPRRADLESDFRIAGNNAVMTIKNLSLGEPKIDGAIGYTSGAQPIVSAKLHTNILTLPTPDGAPAAKAEATKSSDKKIADAAPIPAKIDFDINPPQLPFALKFDLLFDRLVKGDFAVTDLHLAGTYDGHQALTLTSGNGTVNGGTLSAIGSIADLKALSGVDMQAGLKTSDLESFVQAMTGKPLALSQKIGDFNGTVKAKGDRKRMNVDANIGAMGYTINAAGTLEDPLSPELPGTINIRLRHPDLVTAIRAFSPGFGNTSGASNKPVDIAGTAKISGKTYEFSDMKGMLGQSDIAGSLKADLTGSVPAITANLTSKSLDVGSLVGVKSKSIKTSGTTGAVGPAGNVETTSSSSGQAGQWSREPLDTGFLKAANIDIKLNAGTLTYGTWVLTDAKAGVDMKNGTLKVSPLSGNIYGGTLDANVEASSAGDSQPLNVAFKADVNNVSVGPFLQALMSSSQKRADGTGSVAINIKGAGTSSAQLMNALNGTVSTQTKKLVIYGMDIDKLAANIVEAFDGGWKGVLAGFTQSGFSGGQTDFNDVDQKFTIANGAMPVSNFKLETTKGNAIVITNGEVNFANWNMNLQSNVQVTQPKDVPVISIRLAGPLDSPQKSVNSQALDNLVRSKLGNKVQDLVTDKLGKDSAAGALINNFLGGGKQAAPAPAPAQAPVAPATTAPAETSPATATPAPAPVEQKKTPQEQLLEGVLNQLSR